MLTLQHNHALVVLSGGQDSTTCLFWAMERFRSVAAITVDYGQRHARELEAARNVIRYAELQYSRRIPQRVVELGPILRGTSPLTNAAEPLEQYPNFDAMAATIGDRVEKTFVPMRNALFLTLAANEAAVTGAGTLVTGVCQADGANYPDCTREFIGQQEAAINRALGTTDPDVGLYIYTPLMDLSKAESIALALRIPGAYPALALSHTAYDGAYPPLGQDHATLLRAEGFRQAGVPDPLILRAVREKLMDMPTADNYQDPPVEAARQVLNSLPWLDAVLHGITGTSVRDLPL